MASLVPPRRFDIPSILLHGAGSRRHLPSLVRELGGRRVLLVTDPGVIQLGSAQEIQGILEREGFAVEVFSDVQPDPTDENVRKGIEALEAHAADILVAIGGGSPIDAAKMISVWRENPGALSDLAGWHRLDRAGVPLIAVPTTAGTGSEATKVAVITDVACQVKRMLLSAPLLPRAAVVDYELTLSMPPALTAAVGVDTLTHGMEAYVSSKANVFSDPLALQCVSLCGRHLRTAWEDPGNRVAREGMMQAATLGGMAFSNSSVALVHGMSRPLGALFHLPHGLSNALLLPAVTAFSISGAENRYATVARAVGCANHRKTDNEACEALVTWLRGLNAHLQIPRLAHCRWMDWEKFERVLEKMADDALASGSPSNNPRVPTAAEIVALYRQCW